MDNAGENKMLVKICDQNEMGIKFEYSAPGTPQQNGVVERAFATLIGRGRAMMNHARFTVNKRREMWCEAAQTATVLDNVLVQKKEVNHLTLIFMVKIPSMQSISEPLVK